jgi:transposase
MIQEEEKYEFLKVLKRKKEKFFIFNNEHIIFDNGCYISIQCSQMHYSDPKKNIEDVSQYEKYEIACFSPDNRWLMVNLNGMENIWEADFNTRGKYGYFFAEEYELDSVIAPYVDKEKVEKIYQFLKSIKIFRYKKVLVEKDLKLSC